MDATDNNLLAKYVCDEITVLHLVCKLDFEPIQTCPKESNNRGRTRGKDLPFSWLLGGGGGGGEVTGLDLS